jgi:pyruvate formate lyase activating enzyme
LRVEGKSSGEATGDGALLLLVADVRRNALDDGPGIRSTVFLKGCPLACAWCQNPETLSPKPELQHQAALCIGCRTCEAVCPERAVAFVGDTRQRATERCVLCGRCADECPPAALRVVGTPTPVEELAAALLRDEPFYRASGGGVTFSGGEPTLQHRALVALAGRLHAHGVHLLLETCGLFRPDPFFADLLPLLDLVYFDVKIADPSLHERYTGHSNREILANLERLAREAAGRLLPRVPLVPGITDTDENLAAIARHLAGIGLGRVAVLPYNPLWVEKRAGLGLPASACDRASFMSEAEVERCRTRLRDGGLEVVKS